MSQPAFDFDDIVPDEFADPTFTVGELAEAINEQLQRGFRGGIWVRGEISDLSNRGAHTYFSLIEAGDKGKAVLNVQLFAPTKQRLAPLLRKFRLELRNGMNVRINGDLDFWAQGGRLGFKMANLDPKFTIGDIAQSRDEVMRRLTAEGLLDTNRRVRVSPVPLRVGVVASVGTAAWHDFRDELERSGIGFQLSVADVRVQGDMAENMVTAAIARFALRRDLDAIVVIRGGGARNELAVFDSEKIARTIAACPVPVLTGLGHEIDRSVADEVAHTALKTPTACAGALIERIQRYIGETEQAFASIVQRSEVALSDATNDLSETAHRIARRTHAAVERSDERLKCVSIAWLEAAPPHSQGRPNASTAHLPASSNGPPIYSLVRHNGSMYSPLASAHLIQPCNSLAVGQSPTTPRAAWSARPQIWASTTSSPPHSPTAPSPVSSPPRT